MERNTSIDLIRGLVMIIMALDHVRDLLHVDSLTQSPTDLSSTTPVLFFTRWITLPSLSLAIVGLLILVLQHVFTPAGPQAGLGEKLISALFVPGVFPYGDGKMILVAYERSTELSLLSSVDRNHQCFFFLALSTGTRCN